jgi:molybdopterin/thiamine biosynthesis adenylyltransferase
MQRPWKLTLDENLYGRLHHHLFRNDQDEHAAVIAAGLVETDRGARLLGRELFLAQDDVDFVPGVRGYRRLTAEFVGEKIAFCRDENLCYLAVHNHGGDKSVEFSKTDVKSHERGYPALLEIAQQPVGALVLAENALAADIWTPDGSRRSVAETVVVGRNIQRIYPSPPPPPPVAEPLYDRQARWFGDRGQHLLGGLKIGVIGGGGVGQPLVSMLARLGVGEVVLVEPERIEPKNLPRLADAHRLDAMVGIRKVPLVGEALGSRFSTKKVRLARRVAKRANHRITFTGIDSNVVEPRAARSLVDCDFLFLAADSHQARNVFNAITHQYLIPGIQIGTKIVVDDETGEVGDISGNVRLVIPTKGCLRCSGLISPAKLALESMDPEEHQRNEYIKDVPASSVITFNTRSASQALSDFLLMLGNFVDSKALTGYELWRPRLRQSEQVEPILGRANCRDCGTIQASRRARGDAKELPIKQISKKKKKKVDS